MAAALKPYQVRFIDEYRTLVMRLEKLNNIIIKYENNTLDFEPNCPLELLKEQRDVMLRYAEILIERSAYEDIKFGDYIEHVG